MEVLNGGSFDRVLAEAAPLSRPAGATFGAQIVMAVRAVHKLGFIHRDLKPDNIALDHQGKIKLLDFGLARSHPAGSQSAMSRCGTPRYMAPEMAFTGTYTESVDWWSFGMLMIDCMDGYSSRVKAPLTAESFRAGGDRAKGDLKKRIEEFFAFIKKWSIAEEEDATHLVRELLVSADKRLDVCGIMKHDFFSRMDLQLFGPEGQQEWRDEDVQKMGVWYKPPVDGPDDISRVGVAHDPTFEPFPEAVPCGAPKLLLGQYTMVAQNGLIK
mmetsp:Transcript_4802/g.10347  ORF Transcript_4802/g.10347 Transcript_4802/m.10347 type:complete len:270 (+) Transcript_4802:847-1656(+)